MQWGNTLTLKSASSSVSPKGAFCYREGYIRLERTRCGGVRDAKWHDCIVNQEMFYLDTSLISGEALCWL